MTNELPEKSPPRDAEKKLKAAMFRIKTLEREIEIIEQKKAANFIKPLNRNVKFEDLMQKLLQIHLAENNLVEFGEGSIPIIQRANAADIVQRCGEMMVLLATYLKKIGVKEKAQKKLFENLNEEEWQE